MRYTALALMVVGLWACGGDGPTPALDAAVPDGAVDAEPNGGAGPDAASDTGASAEAAAQDASPDGAPPEPEGPDVYAFANACVQLVTRDGQSLAADDSGTTYAATDGSGASFFMKASDLGTYLFYDAEAGYLLAEDGPLLRVEALESDISRMDDSFISGAEWNLEIAGAANVPNDEARFLMRHRKTGRYLAKDGLTRTPAWAEPFELRPAGDCLAHPELSLDAEGTVTRTRFDDGDLYGYVDTHSHLLSNFGFGGGGIFHGSTFHRLGVEHALMDCRQFHGDGGRLDYFGWGFAGGDPDLAALLPALISGQLGEDTHATEGYPQFTDWPHAADSPTHQAQYYRWLERAWLSGLRLVVQHATTNSVICEFMVGQGYQPARYSCNDMVAVDRILEETFNMERYIDAQAGGPGKGFFRIVDTPEAAREVVAGGKLAVVLGIETSNLFDCFAAPRDGFESCDIEHVRAELDRYQALGVRVLFPVHKYDNAFSAGDGHRGFIELGNFLNSGYWSSFVDEGCPDAPGGFDRGNVTFGGLNQPRDMYSAAPPNDMSGFEDAPVLTLTPFLPQLAGGSLQGEYCQKHGLTELGEALLLELMERGMIIELDHLPQHAYVRAFELLEQHDYPAAGTHGRNNEGRLYALGGVSKMNFGRCRDPEQPGAMLRPLARRIASIEAEGGYPAEGFGFDFNGFAGAPAPRFGADSRCDTEQTDPVGYPFDSFAGDVTFTTPKAGERTFDFNTEGMAHIGLLPELIEDVRRDAESDADLEPLFRSAEGYLRMWERAEARAAALRAAP